MSSSKTECIICGDMNIDLLKTHSDPNAANYLDTLVSNSYLPAITLPTRKRFSEKPIVAFTNSTIFILHVDFYIYD